MNKTEIKKIFVQKYETLLERFGFSNFTEPITIKNVIQNVFNPTIGQWHKTIKNFSVQKVFNPIIGEWHKICKKSSIHPYTPSWEAILHDYNLCIAQYTPGAQFQRIYNNFYEKAEIEMLKLTPQWMGIDFLCHKSIHYFTVTSPEAVSFDNTQMKITQTSKFFEKEDTDYAKQVNAHRLYLYNFMVEFFEFLPNFYKKFQDELCELQKEMEKAGLNYNR